MTCSRPSLRFDPTMNLGKIALYLAFLSSLEFAVATEVDFNCDIRPILSDNCLLCG
ncbi:hypothetical protein Pla52n_19830 [Stieleria varia]|uniref:Uncharacterized protein n=1 Tax=Stieleria varia TaxID=2528005 RepID=A0A5C6B3Y1_9BACT|nr:hypothetical protein Pla52n_19830 [Stieleria varia]